MSVYSFSKDLSKYYSFPRENNISYSYQYVVRDNTKPSSTYICKGKGLPVHIHPKRFDLLIVEFKNEK